MAGLIDKAKEFVAEKIAGMEKPDAEVKGVSLKDVSRDCVTLETLVDIVNPYSHDIPICEISYVVRSADREIASGTIEDPGNIKAKDRTEIKVPAKVPYSILFSLARDIGSDWDIDYKIEIGLRIDLPIVGVFTIPLSYADTLKLPTFKDLFSSD